MGRVCSFVVPPCACQPDAFSTSVLSVATLTRHASGLHPFVLRLRYPSINPSSFPIDDSPSAAPQASSFTAKVARTAHPSPADVMHNVHGPSRIGSLSRFGVIYRTGNAPFCGWAHSTLFRTFLCFVFVLDLPLALHASVPSFTLAFCHPTSLQPRRSCVHHLTLAYKPLKLPSI